MPDISTVGGLAWASLSGLGGLAKASVSGIGGLSVPAGSTGITPIFAFTGAPASVSSASAENTGLVQSTSNWGAANSCSTSMPVAGAFSKLYIVLETAPGAGKSYTYSMYINGAATALSVQISDSNTSGSDTSHSVSVAVGDTVSWEASPAGTPTAPTTLLASCLFTPTTSGESFVPAFAPNVSASATNYCSLFSTSAWSTTENIASTIIPTGGVLDKFYARIAAGGPGSGKSYAFTVYKNGSPTSVTCTISDSGVVSSDLSHTISVAAGDTISIESVPSGTPSSRNLGFSFRWVPTVIGESFVAVSGTAPSNSASAYYSVQKGGQSAGAASATTAIRCYVPVACTMKKLYTSMSTAAGASKSRTARSYINSGYGNLSASVGGDSDTTGNDTSHTDTLAIGDYIYLVTDPSGTPASTTYYKMSAVILT